MKKVVALLFTLLATCVLAQEPLRVLILPFDASQSFEPYGLGVATGLQRTLNSLDGIYSPSVAEAGLFVTRAFEADLEALEVASEAFAADAVISGAVRGSGERLEVTLIFSGPGFAEPQQVDLQVANEPGAILENAALTAIASLERDTDEARARVTSLAAEAPDTASLGSVSRASSRLGADLGALTAAAQLNPESSWALAERARALALAGRGDEALAEGNRAVAANPEDAEAWVVLGVVAGAVGDQTRSLEGFERALELNPQHALALVGLAGHTEDAAAARGLLERAVVAAPRQVDAVLRLAELESSPQRALQSLRRASEHLPESVALHRAFVERAVAAGDARGALAYLSQVTSQPLATSPALYAQAALLPTELTEEALALVGEGRERFPESSGLQLAEADLLRRAGQNQEAVAVLADLHERFPESVEVANSLAVTLAESGDIDRARDVFTSVADDSPTVQLNLGRLLLRAGQARAALATLEPLLAEDPEDAELHALYGIALGRTGRVDEALLALDRALELDPQDGEAARARSLLQQQQQIVGDDAIAFEGEAATAFEQGLYALETDDAPAAARSFGRAHELSSHPLAAFYQGYALQRAGEIRSAVPQYQMALEAYPESDTVLNNLGYAQLQLGRLDLALDLLRRAVAANGNNPSAHVNLGLTYYGLGRFDDALAAWDRAVAIEPALAEDLADIRGRAEAGRGPQ